MDRCDLCPRRHRAGSRAWWAHLGGRDPEDIAVPGGTTGPAVLSDPTSGVDKSTATGQDRRVNHAPGR